MYRQKQTRLPVASIKPVSKISPVISRNEKQMPRRDVQNICTHTYTRAWDVRKRVQLFCGDGNCSFSFSSFLTRSRSPFPFFLGASCGLCGSTRRVLTMLAYIITQRPRIIGVLIKRPRGVIERDLARGEVSGATSLIITRVKFVRFRKSRSVYRAFQNPWILLSFLHSVITITNIV